MSRRDKSGFPTPDGGRRTHRVSLHVPGILRLLSEHLYGNPRVALRELIQNAHDSCQRRRVEDSRLPTDYTPRIDINLDAERRTLTVWDNGSGLTEEEIHTYLATVGRGYTRELRERLDIADRAEALALVGQFGLGLLSAFVVAERLEMVTRSTEPGAPAWRWESAGEETYTLEPAGRPTPGTTFTLHLKLEGEFLLNEGIVREAIRTYADFLPVPITLSGGCEPVNAVDAPWHTGGGERAYYDYIAARFGVRHPLTVIPLQDHVETIRLPDGTEDTVVTPLRGVLFVPPGSTLSLREYGDVAVYIRRMFINDDERDLLPRWARFLRGVVDSPALSPTASREQVRRDAAFITIQRAVEGQVLKHLAHLARSDTPAWQAIVLAHNDLIKAWALESHTFFEAVCDIVTVETSRGPLTLPGVLEATDGVVYAFAEARGAMQEKMLYEARGLVVVDASRFAEEAFLEAYARTHPGVELVQLEPGADFLFDDEPDDSRWQHVVRYYTEQGIPSRLVRFEPPSIPAVLITPPGADGVADARSALENGEFSGPVAGFIEEYLSLRDTPRASLRGTLHLNAASPLMQHLLALSPTSGAFTAALEIVYHNARILAGRTLTPGEARQGFDLLSYSLEQLVRALTDPSD